MALQTHTLQRVIDLANLLKLQDSRQTFSRVHCLIAEFDANLMGNR